MSEDTIILAGRGPSVYGFDFPDDVPVMAVSSGVFALKGLPTLRHFCSLDKPGCFMSNLSPHVDIAWGNDPKAEHWPFWADPAIEKHVPEIIAKPGHIRPMIPYSVLSQLPQRDQECIEKVFDENPSLTGYQTGWGDFYNVTGHPVMPQSKPNFTSEGDIGLWSKAAVSAGFDAVRHSMLFAVQLAARLGFTTVLLIGCDLHGDRFPVQRATMREWWLDHLPKGHEWYTLSPASQLGDWMSVTVLAEPKEVTV